MTAKIEKKSRNYKLDIDTINRLNRLLMEEKGKVTEQGLSPLSVTAGDIIAKAIKAYDEALKRDK